MSQLVVIPRLELTLAHLTTYHASHATRARIGRAIAELRYVQTCHSIQPNDSSTLRGHSERLSCTGSVSHLHNRPACVLSIGSINPITYCGKSDIPKATKDLSQQLLGLAAGRSNIANMKQTLRVLKLSFADMTAVIWIHLQHHLLQRVFVSCFAHTLEQILHLSLVKKT